MLVVIFFLCLVRLSCIDHSLSAATETGRARGLDRLAAKHV